MVCGFAALAEEETPPQTPWKPIGSAVIHKGAPYGNTRKWLVPHSYVVGAMVFVR